MLGAIAGDIIGSVYEARPIKTTDFPLFRWDCRFTDDTVLSVAVAEAILRGIPYAEALKTWYHLTLYHSSTVGHCRVEPRRYRKQDPAEASWSGPTRSPLQRGFVLCSRRVQPVESPRRRYDTRSGYHAFPNAGYGGMFIRWAQSASRQGYNSWGNGSAMRVSPVGFAFDTLDQVLAEAKRSADPTHDHPEGIKGAQATAAAVFLARTGSGKDEMRDFLRTTFSYPLRETLDEIRPGYRFDPSCQGTVPVALTAFLESSDFEDAVRKAVSAGGDSDTLACITGGIAHAFYGGVPPDIGARVDELLHPDLAAVAREFCAAYGCAATSRGPE